MHPASSIQQSLLGLKEEEPRSCDSQGKGRREEGGGGARGTEEARGDRREKLPWQEPIRRQRSGKKAGSDSTAAEAARSCC